MNYKHMIYDIDIVHERVRFCVNFCIVSNFAFVT